MVRKADVKAVENLGGGKGTAYVHHIISKEEMLGHGRLYARVVLPPGSSVGWHQHGTPQRARLFLHEGADEIQLLLCEFYHGTISGFINCNHDLLHIPCLVGIILFDDIHKPSSFFGKK